MFSVALEGVHETLGFYRRQFEDVSSNLLGPKSSKHLKLSDHLHLTHTMTQARGTLLLNSSRIFAQPGTINKLFPTICGKGIFLIPWSQGKRPLRVLIVLSQHWCELTCDSTIVSNSAPSLPQPPKESGTLPHCEDKNGERSMVVGTGLGRQFLHSTGRQ